MCQREIEADESMEEDAELLVILDNPNDRYVYENRVIREGMLPHSSTRVTQHSRHEFGFPSGDYYPGQSLQCDQHTQPHTRMHSSEQHLATCTSTYNGRHSSHLMSQHHPAVIDRDGRMLHSSSGLHGAYSEHSVVPAPNATPFHTPSTHTQQIDSCRRGSHRSTAGRSASVGPSVGRSGHASYSQQQPSSAFGSMGAHTHSRSDSRARTADAMSSTDMGDKRQRPCAYDGSVFRDPNPNLSQQSPYQQQSGQLRSYSSMGSTRGTQLGSLTPTNSHIEPPPPNGRHSYHFVSARPVRPYSEHGVSTTDHGGEPVGSISVNAAIANTPEYNNGETFYPMYQQVHSPEMFAPQRQQYNNQNPPSSPVPFLTLGHADIQLMTDNIIRPTTINSTNNMNMHMHGLQEYSANSYSSMHHTGGAVADSRPPSPKSQLIFSDTSAFIQRGTSDGSNSSVKSVPRTCTEESQSSVTTNPNPTANQLHTQPIGPSHQQNEQEDTTIIADNNDVHVDKLNHAAFVSQGDLVDDDDDDLSRPLLEYCQDEDLNRCASASAGAIEHSIGASTTVTASQPYDSNHGFSSGPVPTTAQHKDSNGNVMMSSFDLSRQRGMSTCSSIQSAHTHRSHVQYEDTGVHSATHTHTHTHAEDESSDFDSAELRQVILCALSPSPVGSPVHGHEDESLPAGPDLEVYDAHALSSPRAFASSNVPHNTLSEGQRLRIEDDDNYTDGPDISNASQMIDKRDANGEGWKGNATREIYLLSPTNNQVLSTDDGSYSSDAIAYSMTTDQSQQPPQDHISFSGESSTNNVTAEPAIVAVEEPVVLADTSNVIGATGGIATGDSTAMNRQSVVVYNDAATATTRTSATPATSVTASAVSTGKENAKTKARNKTTDADTSNQKPSVSTTKSKSKALLDISHKKLNGAVE